MKRVIFSAALLIAATLALGGCTTSRLLKATQEPTCSKLEKYASAYYGFADNMDETRRMACMRAAANRFYYGMTEDGVSAKVGEQTYLFAPTEMYELKALLDSLERRLDVTGNSKIDMALRLADSSAVHPLSVVILPPINMSTKVDAKDSFFLTPAYEVARHGYYLCPPMLMFDIMKNEGLYDTELLSDDMYGVFRQYFNADAILKTTILEWKKAAIANAVKVSINYKLVSTLTGQTLWDKTSHITARINIDTGIGGIWGLLADAVASRIATVTIREITLAWKANAKSIDFPWSVYSWKPYDPYFTWGFFTPEHIETEMNIVM